MIQFNQVSLQMGTKPLFKGLNFTLCAAEKVGLIGQNGAGKSTLFAMLQGKIAPDKGDILLPKNLRLATVKQDTPALAQLAIEYVLDGDSLYREQQKKLEILEQGEDFEAWGKLHEWMLQTDFYSKPAKAGALMHGLGFKFEEQQKSVAEFSGGWRMRLNLAQALIADSDVLLLDEPTNHLDLEAVVWLESWLAQYPGILMVISHDREFLDQVVKVIFHLENGEIRRFAGNYSQFESQRAMQLKQQQASFAKSQRQREHLESFITRFKAKASKAAQAQSRIKALERLGEALPVYENSPFQFSFRPSGLLSQEVLLALTEASLGYGDRVILSKVDFQIPSDAKIGLLGPNGAGKSTLIKALAGEVPILAGERSKSPRLKLGYFSQHQLEILKLEQSPLWHIRQLTPGATEQEIRNFLGQFNFKGDVVFESIEHFSGGEKARLALALIVWQKPNLLLLDEPTNHLDIEMRQALILAIQQYENAVVMISHDRHLLRTATDVLYRVWNGKLEEFSGSVDDYLAEWAAEQKRLNALQNAARKEKKSASPQKSNTGEDLAKQAHSLEKEITALQQQLSGLELKLGDAELYEQVNVEKLNTLLAEQKTLKAKLETAEANWLSVLEAIENRAAF